MALDRETLDQLTGTGRRFVREHAVPNETRMEDKTATQIQQLVIAGNMIRDDERG